MSDICSFGAACFAPAYCRGYCNRHYQQWYNAQRRGATAAVCACGNRALESGKCRSCRDADRGHGTCLCGRPIRYPKSGECHSCYTRRRYHEAKAGIHPEPGLDLNAPLSYEGAHARVRRARGSAKAYDCFSCESMPASDWAYMHNGSIHERSVPCRDLGEVLISSDPSDYVPLCRSCHGHLDRSAKRDRSQRQEQR